MRKIYNILFLFISLTFLFSCQATKENKKETKPTLNDFTSGLIKQDTLDVKMLVNNCMNYLQQKQYADAASMLYKLDSVNVWNEPMLLDNEELERVISLFKRFPVASYKITKIEFHTPVNNEIKCVYLSDTTSTVTNSITFNPVNYLGGWRLCLMN